METQDTTQVWNDLHHSLERFVRRHIDDASDVQDVLQTVFLRVHRSLINGTVPEQVRAWVFETARHAVADFYRARGRRRETAAGTMDDLELLIPQEPEATADGLVDETSLAACLPHFVEQLPAAFRQALRVTAIDGVSQREASTRLGLSEPGMKARVQRGRKRLKDALLECCDVTLDARGAVTDYELRPGGTSPCSSIAPVSGTKTCS
jgi:RNA polymerase sigma-70 factor (ECF subfamily)